MSLMKIKDYAWIGDCDPLGKGSFGTVFKGRSIVTGEAVAIKILDTDRTKRPFIEIDLLKKIKCPYIVKYITSETIRESHRLNEERRIIVCELADRNLGAELRKLENCYGLPWETLFIVIEHLNCALSYLHDEKIAHRDLKPENILVFKHPKLTFKLCDFGLSRTLDYQGEPLNSICGTRGYMNQKTTELLLRMQSSYTADEIDNWSFACTVFKCATGRLPFVAENDEDILKILTIRGENDICGFYANGTVITSEELPETCMYSRSLKEVLCKYFRYFFCKTEGPCVDSAMRSKLSNALISLQCTKYYDINSLCIREHFDASKSEYFVPDALSDVKQCRRNKNEEEIRILDQLHLSAFVLRPPLILNDEYEDRQLAIMTFICVDNKNKVYESKLNEKRSALIQALPPPGFSNLWALIASIYQADRDNHQKYNFIVGLINFDRELLYGLEKRLENVNNNLHAVNRLHEALQAETRTLCMSSPTEEREYLQGNAAMLEKELADNYGRAKNIKQRLKSCWVLFWDIIKKHDEFDYRTLNKDSIERDYMDATIYGGCKEIVDTCYKSLHRKRDEMIEASKRIDDHRKYVFADFSDLFSQSYDATVLLEQLESQVKDAYQLVKVAQLTNEKRRNLFDAADKERIALNAVKMIKALRRKAETEKAKAKLSLETAMSRFQQDRKNGTMCS